MTSAPYIKIWTTSPDDTYPIIKTGSVKRDFLDGTWKSHGYHCQPITTSNLHGWDFILAQDLEVIWDGVSNTEAHHVEILNGNVLPNGVKVAETSTANATVAFNLYCFLETDPDHYLLLSGPPNVFVQGAKPMSALIRSDWYHYMTPQFCWQVTTPNKVVTFKKDQPFLRIINYPKNLIESTSVEISRATPEHNARSHRYGAEREKYYKENPGEWPFLYKKGKEGLSEGSPVHLDKQYRPRPQDPQSNV